MRSIVVLSGGVGGAKFVHGLAMAAPGLSMTVIVNTGDDFRHLGLSISPDIDTVLYTLSGRAHPVQGWGRNGETWSFMKEAKSLGAPDWFNLGDGDLALHILRTERLAAGETLTSITSSFAKAWGIAAAILPMSDAPVGTMLDTNEGVLDFQRYFVARRCEPRVSRIWFDGAHSANAAPGVVDAIQKADAIFFAPSNPYLSIGPILSVASIAGALRQATVPRVAVSPLIAGQAVKGPTSKLMAELGFESSNISIAGQYAGLIDAMLVDQHDEAPHGQLRVGRTNTLMTGDADRRRVAEAALKLAGQ